MSPQVTLSQLMSKIEQLNSFLALEGSDKMELDSFNSSFRITQHGGDVSPLMSKGELSKWIGAFFKGLEIGKKTGQDTTESFLVIVDNDNLAYQSILKIFEENRDNFVVTDKIKSLFESALDNCGGKLHGNKDLKECADSLVATFVSHSLTGVNWEEVFRHYLRKIQESQ